MAVSIHDIREFAAPLPRSYEVLVHDRVKWRVKQIVWLALSRDETLMGFAFPREERAALVASDPEKFLMPEPADERFQWVRARLSALERDELQELIVEAWRMVVPKFVYAEYAGPAG